MFAPPNNKKTWCNYIHDFEFDLRRFCFFSEHVGWVDGWPPGMADVREIFFLVKKKNSQNLAFEIKRQIKQVYTLWWTNMAIEIPHFQ